MKTFRIPAKCFVHTSPEAPPDLPFAAPFSDTENPNNNNVLGRKQNIYI